MMLDAGSINPGSSAWSFLVMIETMKDGESRFLVDIGRKKQRMEGDRLPIFKF